MVIKTVKIAVWLFLYRVKEVNTKEVRDRLINYNKTIPQISTGRLLDFSPATAVHFLDKGVP